MIKIFQFSSVLAFSLFLLANSVSGAENPFSKIEPGLWEQQSKTLLNGQDMMSQMMTSHGSMMNSLPADKKKKMMDQLAGLSRTCVKADDIKNRMSPEAMVKEHVGTQTSCKWSLDKAEGSLIQFSVNCDVPGKYQNKGTIQIEVKNSKSWSFIYKGLGKSLVQGSNSKEVATVITRTSHWVGTDCSAQ